MELRTKAKAGGTQERYPERLAVITDKDYLNGLGLNQEGMAHLQLLSSADGLKFKHGMLFFQGYPASYATLRDFRTKEGIEKIDLPFLRMLYSIILSNIGVDQDGFPRAKQVITLYLPDLMAALGKSRNFNENNLAALVAKFVMLHNVIGVIQPPNSPRSESLMPVMVFHGYNAENNTISFSSPYMNLLIETVLQNSIYRNQVKGGRKKEERPRLPAPSHSYLVHGAISKERNKKAVEIVFLVVATIERAGGPRRDPDGKLAPATPHLKAKTIIGRIPLIEESLKGASASAQNIILKRSFSKAWELLRTRTDLEKAYPGIKLPDPDDKNSIPTTSTLDMVFTFEHYGKKKGYDARQDG